MTQGRSLWPSKSGARFRMARAAASALSDFAADRLAVSSFKSGLSVDGDGDETRDAFAIRDQEQSRFLVALLLRRLDRLRDVAGLFHRLVIDLLDDVARPQAPLRRRRTRIDRGHDHPLHVVLDLEGLARLVAQSRKLHAKRLPDWALRLRLLLGGGDLGLLFAILETAERDRLGHLLAFANDHDLHRLAYRHPGHQPRQVARFLDVPAVELDDHVSRPEPGRLRRPLVVDARDECAARGAQPQAFSDGVVDRLDADAEPAPPRLMVLLELADDRNDGGGRRREADADRTARGGKDGRVDADHFSLQAEQRAARIALVDRSVGLQEIVIRAAVDVAVAGGDDSGRHRFAEAERVSDRHHAVADPHLVAVAELDGLQRFVALHLQHGDVYFRILEIGRAH